MFQTYFRLTSNPNWIDKSRRLVLAFCINRISVYMISNELEFAVTQNWIF